MLQQTKDLLLKEIYTLFSNKIAYVVIFMYAVLSMFLTFYSGLFFDLYNQNLFSFFYFQANIFIILIPALTMRLWADEYKSGTIELLLTQPLNDTQIVMAKFLAAWSICILMLLTTIPLWIYASYHLQTDNLNIVSSYIGCIFISGAFSALGCCVSSFNRSPIISYMLTVFVMLLFVIIDYQFIFTNWEISGNLFIKFTQSLNFYYHQSNLLSGQMGIDDLLYYISIIVLSLWINTITIQFKKN